MAQRAKRVRVLACWASKLVSFTHLPCPHTCTQASGQHPVRCGVRLPGSESVSESHRRCSPLPASHPARVSKHNRRSLSPVMSCACAVHEEPVLRETHQCHPLKFLAAFWLRSCPSG